MSRFSCSHCSLDCSDPVQHLLEEHPDIPPTMATVWNDFTFKGGVRLPTEKVKATYNGAPMFE